MTKLSGTDSKSTLYCSFCGKSQHEVRKLIAGPTVFICDECVELCNDIIREETKAGIAGLTLVAAAELGRYGVTVNALAPAARTRMTEAAFADTMQAPEDGFDAMHPTNVSPLVAWLASEDSADVTGRVIESEGGKLCVE